jgi:hypothetical protein
VAFASSARAYTDARLRQQSSPTGFAAACLSANLTARFRGAIFTKTLTSFENRLSRRAVGDKAMSEKFTGGFAIRGRRQPKWFN